MYFLGRCFVTLMKRVFVNVYFHLNTAKKCPLVTAITPLQSCHFCKYAPVFFRLYTLEVFR